MVLVLSIIQTGIKVPFRLSAPVAFHEPPDLSDLRTEGNSLFGAGFYGKSIEIYQRGYQQAEQRRLKQSAARFLNNLGGAYRQMFRYRDAIQVYLKARDLAIALGDREAWGALCMNLSSVYLQMGNVDAALASAAQGLSLPHEVTARYRPLLLIQAALSTWQKNHAPQALTMLYQAIDAARSRLDTADEAQAWNELGNVLLEDGRLSDADRALGEAYRLRKFAHNERLQFTYESLGRLRVRQGDPESANRLFERALELASTASPPDAWTIYYARGRLRQSQGKVDDAYADFTSALECARRWRAEILPADSFRVSADITLHDVYASYIEIANRLYRKTGDRRYAEAAFSATEESRAASLRALWAGPDLSPKLPDEYWEALSALHRAEVAAIQGGPPAEAGAVRTRRVQIAEIEARAGLDLPSPGYDTGVPSAIEQTRRTLQPDEAFFGFHLGDDESYLWVVAREGFFLRRLPPRAQIGEQVQSFERAIREGSRNMPDLARRIYSELFGKDDTPLLRKPRWVIAPDGPLFALPFSALIVPFTKPENRPGFLVERHAVRIVPGIWALSERSAPPWRNLAVGLGDPVYNAADPRAERPAVQRAAFFDTGRSPHLELARLAGSSREIDSCDRLWRSHGTETLLLRGPEATRSNLVRALEQSPAVVHVAAHLLFPPEQASPGMLALTIGVGRNIELLSAAEIASLRLNLGLVVLNGCYSARAPALPGAGLMGMTRAWLAAGAQAVIATRWSTPDQDEGRLFQSFYSRMSARTWEGQRRFSDLLRDAQLDELRAGGPRANPARWASYFCVERH